MIKTLIADDNLIYIKQFINNVTSKFNNIQIDRICTDGKEAFDVISKNNFDLIFLDLQMPNINGIDIIKRIKELNSIKIPKVVIISGDMPLIKFAEVDNIVCSIIQKNEDTEIIHERILSVIREIEYNENYDGIKDKIVNDLIDFGYNMKHKGTRYIIDAIMYIYSSNDFNLIDNLEKNVYKYVSFKNKDSIVNIKNNIVKCSKNIVEDDIHLSAKDVITKVLIGLNREFLFSGNVD